MSTDSGLPGTVVVGCDRSWASQNAVMAGIRQAALRGAALVLLGVVEGRPFWPDDLSGVARAEAESTREAQAAVDLAMAKVVASGVKVAAQAMIVKELESAELAELAGRAVLLVVGRRGDGGQVAFSLGSTSWELARRFPCPVLVVHDHLGPGERQHLGPNRAVITGLEVLTAPTVLSSAAREAALRDVPLVVVHALKHGEGVGRVETADEWRQLREALALSHIPVGAPVRLIITEHDPATALLDRAGPEDLIVVGTRDQGRLAGLVPGSVSRRVLNEMSCDVLVVPAGAGADSPVPTELIGRATRSETQRLVSWGG